MRNLVEIPVGSQVAPSLMQIAQTGMGMDGSGGKDFRTLLRRMSMAAGLNTIHQVNDTETIGDWVESDNGVLDAVNQAAGKVGTNELALTATGACDGSQYVETSFINGSKDIGDGQMNWEDTRYLGMWVTNKVNGDFSTAGEATISIFSNGVEQTAVNVQAIVDDVHQYFQIDMEAAGWDRNSVEKIRIYANVAITEVLNVNNIERYEISLGRGPMLGCMLPITNGTTLYSGQLVNWSIEGAIAGADAVTALGIGQVFKDGEPVASGLGNAARDVWIMVPGIMLCILRASGTTVAGEGLIYAAAGTFAGQATGVDENNFGRCLEAAGAANDDIFAVVAQSGTFIS